MSKINKKPLFSFDEIREALKGVYIFADSREELFTEFMNWLKEKKDERR